MSTQSNAVLHPDSIEYLRAVSALPAVDYDTLQPGVARATFAAVCGAKGGSTQFLGTRDDVEVPLSGDSDTTTTVPCWVYRPYAAKTKPNPCICIYFHGGGWTVGSRVTHDVICKDLAMRGACIVVNVEYRLAPENKSPACYEDGAAVVKWTLLNKEHLGGSASSLVGVAGDSAGGNIAASLCHTVREGIAFQVLIYPSLDLTCSFPSYKEFYAGYSLSYPYIIWFRKQLLATEEEQLNTIVSPLLHTSFSGQPPAFILVAMCDPLRDEGLAYAEKLENGGGLVEVLKMDGIIHGFLSRGGAFPSSYREACASIGQFLQKF